MNTNNVKVYALHRMKDFLNTNGPWSQLVQLNNISLKEMQPDIPETIAFRLQVTPFIVPHRDEYSETAGFSIKYGTKQVLFIPDIDKWEKFNRNIDSLVQSSSIAFLDGTFYKDGELEGRSMKDIPHPFVSECLKKFSNLSPAEKKRIYFIHFNHTNPLLNEISPEHAGLLKNYNVAVQSAIIRL